MGVLDYVVGRQPIFHGQSGVLGYQLYFRWWGKSQWTPDYTGGSLIPEEALYEAIPGELDRLVGPKLLFWSVSRQLLSGTAPGLLPPERAVLEIPSDPPIDDGLIARSRDLLEAEFALALDDVKSFDGLDDLAALATYAKIPVPELKEQTLAQLVTNCHDLGLNAIATGVDTLDQLNACVANGFDYFQGYLLAKPQLIPGRTLEPSQAARIHLAASLLSEEAPVSQLERIVRSDPALATQLIELAGLGAAGGLRREIRSIHEAIVVVGWRRLQSWLALLLMTDRGTTSEEALGNSLLRARMCEIVARRLDPQRADEAFTAGILSTLDLLLGIPLAIAIEGLPIHPDLRSAVVGHEGTVGAILADVCGMQMGDIAPEGGGRVGEDLLQEAYKSALAWLNENFGRLGTTPVPARR